VAVLSPSGRAAALFPAVVDLGLRRLREKFRLVPVEYPTTRAARATVKERASDIHAAFSDPAIRAVLTTIGGEDELKVLRHLDPDLIASDPKPFFGYSDNTNLHLFLWNLGTVSYHGAAVMPQLGRGGAMHPLTEESLRRALFTHETYTLAPPQEYSDEEGDWREPTSLEHGPPLLPAEPWSWHGPAQRVQGVAWGGSLEIIDFHLRADRYLPDPAALAGTVLFLETSEELPPPSYVYRVLMGMGERGMLSQVAALMWARPKAWSHQQHTSTGERADYGARQRDAVLTAFDEYNSAIPIVFGVDFGHTDPQYVMPSGGEVTVDGVAHRIEILY
jgi:muramoyltetrapeptide carboxypeptidase LdcA involved in peptidoglycan recycling